MKSKKKITFYIHLILILFFVAYSSSLNAQNKDITGTVTSSEDGLPLIGVSVQLKGTSSGTITDINGKYTLKANPNQSLVFSMIGMKTYEIVVQKEKTINVILETDSKLLDQVVVTGYTSQKKADLTGAISVVNVNEITKQGENNPMKAMQGRVPGVSITSDGSPSGSATVRIRGIGTLNNNDPLYVIDGVPTKSGMYELNSADIESIQVLRDASAASIYGSRAGNGVIIITTKQGKKGKTKVNFDTYVSTSHYGKVVNMLNTEEFGKVQWQSMINSGVNPNTNTIGYVYDYGYDGDGNAVLNSMKLPKYIDAIDGTNNELSSNTDWFKAITRPGLAQSYNLSVSNGTDNSNSFFSLGYYDNKGTINDTYFKRYSARINNSFKLLNDLITIGENFTINNSHELKAPDGVLSLALYALPVMPVKTVDGDWASVTSGMLDRDNPARVLDANKDNPYSYWRLFGNTFVDIQPIKNLHVKSSFGIDYGNYYQRYLTYSFTGRLGSDLTSSKIIQSHSMKWTWTNTATYNFKADKNNFDFLLGSEMNKVTDINFSAERRTYDIEDPDYMWPSAGTGDMYTTGSSTSYALMSLFGKIDYSYADKYLASVTLRRDGSSRFGKNNRYATFPAFSAGWRINQENFMKETDNIISDLKLRLGWGQTGNQEIDNYANRTLIQTNYAGDTGSGINSGTAYDISGSNSGMLASGYQVTQMSNDDIKWETTTQTNIGLDFGFLNQSIYGSIEWYLKDTKDILIQPAYIGAIGEGGNQWLNGASMQNKGLEFSLGYRNITDLGLTYDLTANISGYRNKVTKLPESVINSYGGNGTTDNILGRSINSIYGYVADGIFQTQEEVDAYAEQTGKGVGRIKYKNLNEDGSVDSNDRKWICNTDPDFSYGLNIVLGWKNFDLTSFFQGVYGNKVYNSVKKYTDFWAVDQLNTNKSTRLLDVWSTTNTTSTIPAVSYYNYNDEGRTSTYYVENGSFLKLRTLQVGYTLPTKLINKLKIDKARFYINGANLLTIKSSSFTGLDPENPGLAYPISKTYTIGMNISL